ncbi:hypothetical protein CKF54_04470 [Psittacicella hinzii]|uniref:Ferritin-like diiron domain-containing protein n=1 Tax=Psittacicella hinzii TaxID=2028575 RepID=A0A3A1Y4V3_9GAMM|nr:ferritin-like domain-containing protein [Psittacicella hinzii]RIY32605.1 hypothetical protein CKF54_04470 [Psittacicella hinzii]
MINQNLVKLLNDKINQEYFRSNLFLDISGWANELTLKGVQGYFLNLSQKALENVRSEVEYLSECGHLAQLAEIPEGLREFDNIEDLFVYVNEMEKGYRADLNNLLDVCLSNKDFATYEKLITQASSQHAEEFFINSLLHKIAIVGYKGQGLYLIDKELSEKYPLPSDTATDVA